MEKVWVQVGRYGRSGEGLGTSGGMVGVEKVWVRVGRYGRGGEGLGTSGEVW